MIEQRITGYMAPDMSRITTWDGKDLGAAKVIRSWRMPWNSYISNRQYQVECYVDGVVYTGRTMGGGMLYRGKRKRGTNSMVPGYKSIG